MWKCGTRSYWYGKSHDILSEPTFGARHEEEASGSSSIIVVVR